MVAITGRSEIKLYRMFLEAVEARELDLLYHLGYCLHTSVLLRGQMYRLETILDLGYKIVLKRTNFKNYITLGKWYELN